MFFRIQRIVPILFLAVVLSGGLGESTLFAQESVPGVIMDSNANMISQTPQSQNDEPWEPMREEYPRYDGDTSGEQQNSNFQPYQTQQSQPYHVPEAQPFRWDGDTEFNGGQFHGRQSTGESAGGKFRSSPNRFGGFPFGNNDSANQNGFSGFKGNTFLWDDYEIVSVGAPEMETWADSYLLPSIQEGAFQKIFANALWTPRSGSGPDSLGFAQVGIRSTFAFPLPKKESPLLVSPGFSTWFLENKNDGFKNSLDLYSANCEFRWIKSISSQYSLELGAVPGVHSGFKYSTGEGFRVPAHLGVVWKYNPRTRIKLGCAFLDRFDNDWLPFGGVVWTPDELEMVFELVFPNPKISKRVRWWGSAVGNDISDWLYISGELAGDCWTLEDDDGRTHSLAYRDYRFMVGYEKKTNGCVNFAVEVGGMFARKLKSSSDREEISPDPGVFVRLKLVH